MNVSKRTTGSVIAGVLCSALLLASVAGAGTALYMGAKNNGWFDKDDTEVVENTDDVTAEEGAIEVKTLTQSKISLSSSPVLTSGTVSGSTTSSTLTAVVTPTDAINVSLVWEVSFVNASSTWASGKTVTDYVTVTPSSDTLSATVKCVKAFGEQIKVKVYSSTDESISATATVDYYIRPTDASFSMTVMDWNDGEDSYDWQNFIFDCSDSSSTATMYVYGSASQYRDASTVSGNLEGSLAAKVSTSGSTGTKSDTWTATSYTISQDTSYSCWSGYGNGNYTFTSYSDFSYSAMLLKLFYSSGYSPITGSSSLKSTYYNTFSSYSSSPIAKLTVTYKGTNSGLTYSVDYGICFNFSQYSSVSSLSFNNSALYF